MSRILVAYFSASGTTKQVGDRLALGIGADIFEIRPEKPYTESDLRWTNPLARCNREKIVNIGWRSAICMITTNAEKAYKQFHK